MHEAESSEDINEIYHFLRRPNSKSMLQKHRSIYAPALYRALRTKNTKQAAAAGDGGGSLGF
jgi:hypothetical protein